MNATDGPLSLRAIRRFVMEMAAGLGHPESGVDLDLVFFTHHVLRVRRFLAKLPRETRYRLHVFPLPRRFLNLRHRTPRPELRRLAGRVDLYHETTTDNPCIERIPVLTTVHGVCALRRPDILDPRFTTEKSAWFRRALERSDYYSIVSDTSRREFLELFPMRAERVRAIPLGVSAHFHPLPRVAVRTESAGYFGYRFPYLLYVGGIQPNKNVGMVLRVFRRLRESKAYLGRLVLAGDLHYPPEEFRRMLEREGIAEHVVLAGYFDPEDPRLAALYRGASLFLFPSFYEGWTSPPLEAMACGTPVIASSASSIPETVGDGGLLADPNDEEAWVTAAAEILDSPQRAHALAARGLRRAAEFPWSRCIAAHVALYRDILEGSLARPLSEDVRGAGVAVDVTSDAPAPSLA